MNDILNHWLFWSILICISTIMFISGVIDSFGDDDILGGAIWGITLGAVLGWPLSKISYALLKDKK
jgi:hypothetical protein